MSIHKTLGARASLRDSALHPTLERGSPRARLSPSLGGPSTDRLSLAVRRTRSRSREGQGLGLGPLLVHCVQRGALLSVALRTPSLLACDVPSSTSTGQSPASLHPALASGPDQANTPLPQPPHKRGAGLVVAWLWSRVGVACLLSTAVESVVEFRDIHLTVVSRSKRVDFIGRSFFSRGSYWSSGFWARLRVDQAACLLALC